MTIRYPPDDESDSATEIPDDIGNRIEQPKQPSKGTLSLKTPSKRRTREPVTRKRPLVLPRRKKETQADRRPQKKKRATKGLTIPPLKPEWLLTLNTRYAASVFRGRPRKTGKKPIPGFPDFITYLSLVWERAQKNDPWADWYLIRTEERIASSRATLLALENRLALMLRSQNQVVLADLHEVNTPFIFPLAFAAPQGFQVAELIGLYDVIVQSILAARQSARLDYPTAENWLHQGARAVRAAYDGVYGYRNYEVNRILVQKKTPQARSAITKMGQVPEPILKRHIEPSLKPGPPATARFRATKHARKAASEPGA